MQLRFDDFIVDEQNKNFFSYKSSHGLVDCKWLILIVVPFILIHFMCLVGCVRSSIGGSSDSFIVWISRMYALGLFRAQITSRYKQKGDGVGKN